MCFRSKYGYLHPPCSMRYFLPASVWVALVLLPWIPFQGLRAEITKGGNQGRTSVHHPAPDAKLVQPDGFVPNRGQWPAEVVAHADLPGLRLFVLHYGLRWVAYRRLGCHNETDADASGHPGHSEHKVHGHVWEQRFVGPHPPVAEVLFADSLQHKVHYLTGNKPEAWGQELVPVQTLKFKDFYPGIDWVLRWERGLKYEFWVHAGADPSLIRMKVEGLEAEADALGRLKYATQLGDFWEEAPLSWTQDDLGPGGAAATANQHSGREYIESSWQQDPKGWGYCLGAYSREALLVIDPRMVGATYSGSASDNWGYSATYDNAGNMYLGGITFGPGYPTTLGAFQVAFAPGQNQPSSNPNFYYDVSVSKFSANGGQLLYATYLGGQGQEKPSSLIYDENAQSLLVFGRTNAPNFPTSAGAYQTQLAGSYDLFVTRLSNSGGMLASTLVGGSGEEGTNSIGTPYTTGSLHFNYGDDSRGEIVIAPGGQVLIASNTQSSNFPITVQNGTIQGTLGGSQDGILAKLSPNLNQLLFSTYLGGGSMDAAYAIKPGGGDTVYVAGSTFSQTTFFPNVALGYDRSHNGQADGFILQLKTGNPPFNPPGIVALTYCGTSSYDQNFLLERDVDGQIYVFGVSMGNIAQQGTRYFQAGAKQFIQKYSPRLDSLRWSAPFALPVVNGVPRSGGPSLSPTAFLVDRCGKIYLTGWGGRVNTQFNSLVVGMQGLPVTPNALQPGTTGDDMYLMVLGPDADSLIYATYLGGSISAEHVDGGTSRFSPDGIVYHAVCAGCGGQSDFPVSLPAAYPSNASGNCNALVFKLDLELVRPRATLRITPGDTNVCVGSPLRFENLGTNTARIWWTIGQANQTPVHTAQSSTTTYTFTTPGTYLVRLVVEGCNWYDTAYRTVVVSQPPVITKFPPPPACPGDTVLLRVDSLDANGLALSIRWLTDPFLVAGPATAFGRRAVVPAARWFYFEVFSANGCVLTDSIYASAQNPKSAFLADTLRWCWGRSAALQPVSGFRSYRWRADLEITNLNQTVQNFFLLQPRWVYCQVFDDTCTYLDSVYLLPTIGLTVSLGPDLYFCQGLNRTITPIGGTSYTWSDGSSGPTLTLNANTSGFVWVVALDANGCRSLPDTLSYFEDPVVATLQMDPRDTAFAPQTVVFTSTYGPNVDSLYWNFGDGQSSNALNPTHLYERQGVFLGYLLAVSRRSGCSDSIPFILVVDTVMQDFPNAMVAGDAGINGIFRSFTRNIKDLDFKVFDRWGQIIFESSGPEVLWDGKMKGEPVMSGTYVFTARGLGKNGAEYFQKGLIHVVR